MRSASTVTGSREHERPARTIATLACLIGFVCATALYFFAPTPDRLARAVSRLPTGQQERTYLQQRPFDAIGFVAYSDAAPSATFPNASVSAGLMSSGELASAGGVGDVRCGTNRASVHRNVASSSPRPSRCIHQPTGTLHSNCYATPLERPHGSSFLDES